MCFFNSTTSRSTNQNEMYYRTKRILFIFYMHTHNYVLVCFLFYNAAEKCLPEMNNENVTYARVCGQNCENIICFLFYFKSVWLKKNLRFYISECRPAFRQIDGNHNSLLSNTYWVGYTMPREIALCLVITHTRYLTNVINYFTRPAFFITLPLKCNPN